ncbi:hypothetical protein D3C79_993460 [compost metagenome]
MIVGEGQSGGVGFQHVDFILQTGGRDVLPCLLQRVFIHIDGVDRAAKTLRQFDRGGAHIAGDLQHDAVRRQCRLPEQPLGGINAAGAQTGFSQAG